jgi:hypothetical protein
MRIRIDGTRKLVIQSDWKEVAVLFFLELISSNKNSCRFLAYFKLWLLLLLKSLGVITLDMNQLLKPKTAILTSIEISISLYF